MGIHHLLGLKGDATPDQVRARYYKRLAALHPNSRLGESSADKFIALTHAYKQYLVGDDFLNCYRVCANTAGTIDCRCGGAYVIEAETAGRIECDYCSCFVVVEDAPKAIES